MNRDKKTKELKFYKLFATGLFFLMAGIYFFSFFLLKKNIVEDSFWIGGIKAFSEAAMVGALADWFAVTALFHRPLGLKIPHTNLIETKKDSIGENLGDFVVENFITPSTLRPYIEKIDFWFFVKTWLSKPKNLPNAVEAISFKINEIISGINNDEIKKIIAEKGKIMIKKLPLNLWISQGINYGLNKKEHYKILDFVLKEFRIYLNENQDFIRKKVGENSSFLIPKFVDDILAEKIIKGFEQYISEVENDENHPIRLKINTYLYEFSEKLKQENQYKVRIEEMRSAFLDSGKLEDYSRDIWLSIKVFLKEDFSKNIEDSVLKKFLYRSFLNWFEGLEKDEAYRSKIQKWLHKELYQMVLKNRKKVGVMISKTVGNWQGKELSQKLELEVGKDLQYIRINGTLVGGLVGFIIYIITFFI